MGDGVIRNNAGPGAGAQENTAGFVGVFQAPITCHYSSYTISIMYIYATQVSRTRAMA